MRRLLILVLAFTFAGGVVFATSRCGDDPVVPVEPVVSIGELKQVTIDDPIDGSVFPPDFTSPTFLWHDASEADRWRISVDFDDGDPPIEEIVPGAPPPAGTTDDRAFGETNEPYVPTPYQASARSWTPPQETWASIQRRSRERVATVTIRGFGHDAPNRLLSEGSSTLSTSKDPIGAPIFYRDVPLMPAVAEESGVIRPLSQNALPLIAWRLRDVSNPESKIVLEGMPSCANCHSFSADGSTLAMDVDGPQGDKGTYAIVPTSREVVIDADHVITWNSFTDKPKGHKTIGFLSRISPDGRYAVTTLNEALYTANYPDYRFLQVFYATRGILAWYSVSTGEMKALPGADDPAFVSCNPVWTPDGKEIVFCRAEGFDPYASGKPLAREPNDPNEPRLRYGLYRMPFEEGRGGTPVPIKGASHNGMSNTFPKVSPDGKWIVFTKCRNAQLLRPDGRLWIVPLAGGAARDMRCNTRLMNSWHSWSPNSRWLVFSSKARTPYTQMFLTHVDEDGNDTPPVLIPNSTASNRAVNLPEFVNIGYEDLDNIEVPAVAHHRFFMRGLERLRAKDAAGAIPLLEQAVEAEPDFGVAHANLGNAYGLVDRLEDAERHLRRALELNERSAFAWNSLGYVLGRQGKWKDALEHFRRAETLSPRSPYTFNNLGLAMRELGHPERAAAAFERALELDPDFADAHKNLGYAHLQEGRAREAARHYARAVAIDPTDTVALNSLSLALLTLGEAEEAVRHLERVVKLDAHHLRARVSLAWVLATHRDADIRNGARAVELAREAQTLIPGEAPSAAVLDALAAAYAETGRFEEAVAAAERALAATARGADAAATSRRERLRLYEEGKPYRQPSR